MLLLSADLVAGSNLHSDSPISTGISMGHTVPVHEPIVELIQVHHGRFIGIINMILSWRSAWHT